MHRDRSAATSASRCRRTWSTARIRRSPPGARSACSSLSSDRLILASSSPRRRAILEQLGVDFRVEAPDVEELTEGEPRELVLQNALLKLRAVEGERVLAVDSMVVWDGRAHGKPADEAEAERWLRELSGRWHDVMGGIALREHGEERTDVAVTRVRFRELRDADINRYLASGEWMDRAGGYAIQELGAMLVEGIEGDWFNVVGLPVPALLRLAPDLLQP
ncbi:MAG TPA: Maf family protein [Thermoleophilaceae bacterium]|nr:Maf family protein [Thermoleophilaceae bacterium]